MHVALVLTCAIIWILEWRLLNREKGIYSILRTASLSDSRISSTSQIGKLASLVFSTAQKGQLLDAESLARQLNGTLSSSATIVRTCINGLIAVELLGTLFNLWRFGPSFWSSLLAGSHITGRSSIGTAFASSIFGLGWALALSLFDNAVVRRQRENFVRRVTEWLTSAAVEQLPPFQEAAVAQALDQFSRTSESILNKFEMRYATLTQSLLEQIKESSQTLDTRFQIIAENWKIFLANTIK